MSKKLLFSCLFLLGLTVYGFQYKRTVSPPGAEVYFISPADGDVVTSPVTIKFGLRGMGVAPAGLAKEKTGHHHILIDTDIPKDLGMPILTNAQHVHFGGGQTETELELAPGKHTLQLLLADLAHVPHDPVVKSKKITITVK